MILARNYQVGDKLPTYRELAQHFGVALFTVERVMKELAREGIIHLLHGKGAFVKQLPAADGQLRQVGLIYSASRLHLIRTSYLSEILAGIVGICDKQQIDLQILSFWMAGRHIPVPPHETAVRIDGAILLGVLNESYIAEFVREEIPLVLVDARPQAARVASIVVDNIQAVEQAMEHLCSLGHRRIAYVGTKSSDLLASSGVWVDSSDSIERREAYLAAMERHGLAEHRRVYEPSGVRPEDAIPQVIQQLRQESDLPTAILAYDTNIAGHLYRGLCEAGIRAPRDVSIAGIIGSRGQLVVDDLVLTSGMTAFEEMGRLAMQSLSRQATGQTPGEPLIERVGTVLTIGSSTTPPRS